MVDKSNPSSNLGEGPHTSAVRVKTSLFNAVAGFQQVSIPLVDHVGVCFLYIIARCLGL